MLVTDFNGIPLPKNMNNQAIEVRPPGGGSFFRTVGQFYAEVKLGTIKTEWPARVAGDSQWRTVAALVNYRVGLENEGHRPMPARESLSFFPPHDALCMLRRKGNEDGPFLPDQIRKMWNAGQIKADTAYTFEQLGEWFPVRNMFLPPPHAPQGRGGPPIYADGLSASGGPKTDIFAILTFASGIASLMLLPIVFAPACFVLSIVSHFRLKENPNLKGRALRYVGAVAGAASLLYLFYVLGIGPFSRR